MCLCYLTRVSLHRYHDVSAANPDVMADMLAEADKWDKTSIEYGRPLNWRQDGNKTSFCAAADAIGGYWVPYIHD